MLNQKNNFVDVIGAHTEQPLTDKRIVNEWEKKRLSDKAVQREGGKEEITIHSGCSPDCFIFYPLNWTFQFLHSASIDHHKRIVHNRIFKSYINLTHSHQNGNFLLPFLTILISAGLYLVQIELCIHRRQIIKPVEKWMDSTHDHLLIFVLLLFN